jgi:hypothetical protein
MPTGYNLPMTQPSRRPAPPLTEQSIEFSYTIFWTKMARNWDEEKRQTMLTRVEALIAAPDFINNAFERKYTIEGLDEVAHSGASLLALKKVLEAFIS